MAPELVHHVHGKSRVRVARTWREGATHHFVEWNVEVIIESDMAHAYKTPSNEGMTATDTTKNQCYVVARRMRRRCAPEEYALALARQFLDSYPLISAVHVRVEQQPWRRVEVMGRPHDHGFAAVDLGVRVASALARRGSPPEIVSGILGARLLKTTQSGYEGFLRDKHTGLQNTRDRILATALDAEWSYERPLGDARAVDFDETYARVTDALTELFYGPPRGGVYSPSVQYTLYQMGAAAVERAKEVRQITLTAPNLHFIPARVPGSEDFDDDVYVATSEPHGRISATVSSGGTFTPPAKL